MAAVRLSIETVFLRNFAEAYVSQISFTERAMSDLQRCGVGLADVMHVLRKGRVTTTIKEDAEGAGWCVDGDTCDGKPLLISLRVWCDLYQVRVLRVLMALGEDNE